jgi:hypothetical protein
MDYTNPSRRYKYSSSDPSFSSESKIDKYEKIQALRDKKASGIWLKIVN